MKRKSTNKNFVKCSHRLCNSMIRIKPNASLKEEKYCRVWCILAEKKYRKQEAEKKEAERRESKAKLMDGAFAIFSVLMEMIREDEVSVGLLNRINKEIGKAK